MKTCWHCRCRWGGLSRGRGGCNKCFVSPGPEVGPDGVQEVGIGRPETTGRGMAVEEVREGGGRKVVEGFEGDE